ncbi:unnamed protein product [Rotaria sordida]|uniref:Uncharacterized protein n=1 Tax=Rotaria sordida TaxID=392033 RepID=A0A816ELV8_9BILA|nr:unnamed protein product [Rotaria sordida]CAF1648090.1 unnamed protein product [Rotaria sordida]
MEKEYFRFYIKVRTVLHIEPIAIHNELHTVLGDEAPRLRTVQRWSKWPITETTPENIRQVHNLINDDPYVTVDELKAQSNLSHGIIQRIISNHLQLKKVTARYVPKHSTNFQKAERVRLCQENLLKFEQGVWRLCDVVTGNESWFYYKQICQKSSNAAWVARGDPSPAVVQCSHFAPKTLLCIFFKSTDPVLIHSVKRGQIIDHQYYINNCLRPVINEIGKQRPA